MKSLSLIICFLLLSASANSNVSVSINNNHTTIAQNNKIKKKKSFKNFLKTVETINGHKLKTADKIKLRVLYQIQRFSNHSQKKANRLVSISLAFSIPGLVLIAAISAIGLFSFIGLAFCITGFILSIIAFKKGKKQPGFLTKRNMIIATIACIISLIGISLAIFLTLLFIVFGLIGEGVASISAMIG
jgi:hypothetical protein